LTSSV